MHYFLSLLKFVACALLFPPFASGCVLRGLGPSLDIDVLTATAQEISFWLSIGSLRSVDLVNLYLERIEKHDPCLNAIIQVAPKSSVLDIAALRDYERRVGRVRSPLHGQVVLVKDSIATHPDLEMDTTAGTFALTGTRVRGDHPTVERLRKAGAIILGKTNMSVWSNFRANFGRIPNGWSPRGNQTRSAYGPRLDAGGSSSGSAVAVSAGFAPLALAAETDGSIIFPANRAALYGIKPTVGLTEAGGGLLSIGGAVPVARSLDSVGVMAKSVWDLTAALGLMAEDLDVPGKMGWGFWDAVETGKRDLWRGMRIGIGSRKVYFDAKTVGSLRIVEACEDAIRRMSDLGAELVEVEMPGLEAVLTHKDEQIITRTEFKQDIEQYLSTLTGTSLRTLSDVIGYNKLHAAVEMPPGYCCQENFEEALPTSPDSEAYRAAKRTARKNSQENGIDYALRKSNVSVIMVPAEGPSSAMAALSGYPIATAPLGYLAEEGRPFGIAVFATAGREHSLLKFLAAWEQTFPARKAPDLGWTTLKLEKAEGEPQQLNMNLN